MTDATPEVWLPIAGYEDLYEVSSLGQVRSLDRTVPHRYSGQVRLKGRILKPAPCPPFGYLKVNLSSGGIERTTSVHVLVAEAFHGQRPPGMEVLHGPGGLLDNRATNLCWGTPSANQQDKRRDGTDHQRNKVVCPRGHLLVAPNLVAAPARRGCRSCLACGRAMSFVRHALNRHGVVLDLQAESDRYYADIMLGA